MKTKKSGSKTLTTVAGAYSALVTDISTLLDQARQTTVKVSNSIIATTYCCQ